MELESRNDSCRLRKCWKDEDGAECGTHGRRLLMQSPPSSIWDEAPWRPLKTSVWVQLVLFHLVWCFILLFFLPPVFACLAPFLRFRRQRWTCQSPFTAFSLAFHSSTLFYIYLRWCTCVCVRLLCTIFFIFLFLYLRRKKDGKS